MSTMSSADAAWLRAVLRIAMHALPHGGSGTMKAGENHYAATTGRTEISIQSTGPFEINYVNPKDDPRNKKGNKPKV